MGFGSRIVRSIPARCRKACPPVTPRTTPMEVSVPPFERALRRAPARIAAVRAASAASTTARGRTVQNGRNLIIGGSALGPAKIGVLVVPVYIGVARVLHVHVIQDQT